MFDASKKEHTYTYVYERDGAVEGYLIYHGGKREETRIDELIALTRQARAGLLGLLRRHEMQVDKFCWNAPIDDGLWSTLTHPDVETKLRSRTMARIVDVAGAFECITCCPDLRCALTLRVADEIAPWNEAPWRIEAEGGRVTARRGGEPQISVGVQALAQAYLGSPTVAELRAAGLIAVHDEAGYRALEALLAGPPAWCNDGF
jgi:predicted acetyltransferase